MYQRLYKNKIIGSETIQKRVDIITIFVAKSGSTSQEVEKIPTIVATGIEKRIIQIFSTKGSILKRFNLNKIIKKIGNNINL